MKNWLIGLLCFCSCISKAQNIQNFVSSLKTDKEKADTLLFFARNYLLKPRFDSANYCLNMGEEFAKKTNSIDLISKYQVFRGSTYSFAGKFRTALIELEKADDYLEKNNIYGLKSTALLTKANCYNFLDKKDSALYFYYLAEKYNNENLPYRNWAVYTAVGELYNRAKDYEASEKYYLKAYNLTVNKVDKPDLAYVLMLLSNFYIVWNKPDKAGKILEAYNNLMIERKKMHKEDQLQNIISTLTNNRFENNISFMKEIKESSLKNGNLNQAIIANTYIINYYEKKQNFTDALQYATENDSLANKTDGLQNIIYTKDTKYKLLQKMGKYSEANAVAEALFVLKDSILKHENREQLYALEKKYETERKEKEISLLESENKLNSNTIALLTKDKKLATLYLQQQILQKDALATENILKDSIVKKEKNYNDLLVSENITKSSELYNEQELKNALKRENELKSKQLQKEKNTKTAFAIGAGLLLLSGISILVLYKKQIKKNQLIIKQSNDLEILMKEIHHRVKNNLQVVSSLLDLQSHSIENQEAIEAVKEGKNRVQSMALIHQNLYSEGNIKGILVKDYINNLVQSLCVAYNISTEKTKVNCNIANLNLDVDTMIPLGLVLNEIISNSFKYAFINKENGILNIELKEHQANLFLKVSDNGNGFPINLDLKNSKSFGLKMIKAFAQKLKAKLEIYNNNGAVVELLISKFKIA